MSDPLHALDDLLADWKTRMLTDLPGQYDQWRTERARLNEQVDSGEITYRDSLPRRRAIDTRYGTMVQDWGLVAKQGATNPQYPALLAHLDREAQRKRANVTTRCEQRIGGITRIDWATIRNGEIEGIITGPTGRIHLHAILAGGWNIQRLHIRFLMNRLKD